MKHTGFSLLPLLFLTACGGSSGGGAGPAALEAVTADLLLQEEGTTELLGAVLSVTALRLIDDTGAATADLLVSERSVDLTELDQGAAWLARATLEPRTYVALELEVDPTRLEVLDEDGSELAADVGAERVVLDLVRAWSPVAGDYERLAIEVDVEKSLEREDGADEVTLELAGAVRRCRGDELLDVAMLYGKALKTEHEVVRLAAHADADRSESLGELSACLAEDAFVVHTDGTMFEGPAGQPVGPAFADQMAPGFTELAATGQLAPDGMLELDHVQMTTEPTRPAHEPIVVVAGVVAAVSPEDQQFVLLLRRVLKGQHLAAPVLASSGPPRALPIEWDRQTVFLKRRGKAEAEDLRVGQSVCVAFSVLGGPPFLADRVHIRRQHTRFHGRIVDTTNLPDSLVVRVNDLDPLVVFGHVDHPQKLLTVALDGETDLFLDVRGRPELSTDQLFPGARIRVRGTFAGPPQARVVGAKHFRVRRGRLSFGIVADVELDAARISNSLGFVTRTFSFEHPRGLLGALDVVVNEETLYEYGAGSLEELAEVLAEAQADGRAVVVDVRGVEHSDPDAVEGYVVTTLVEEPAGDGPDGGDEPSEEAQEGGEPSGEDSAGS